jgi:Na+-driven multidrug efflux pump
VRVRALALPFELVVSVANGVYRGLGDTATPGLVAGAAQMARVALGAAALLLPLPALLGLGQQGGAAAVDAVLVLACASAFTSVLAAHELTGRLSAQLLGATLPPGSRAPPRPPPRPAAWPAITEDECQNRPAARSAASKAAAAAAGAGGRAAVAATGGGGTQQPPQEQQQQQQQQLQQQKQSRSPNPPMLWCFAHAAGALFLRTAVLQTALAVNSRAAAALGAAPSAAHVVARQLASFLSLALDALAVAAQALVAQTLAAAEGGGGDSSKGKAVASDAQRPRRRAVVRRVLALGLACAAAAALPLVLLPGAVGRLFSADTAVLRELRTLLPVLGALQLLAAPAYVLDGVLLGAADFRFMAAAMVPAAAACVAASGVVGGLLGVWCGFGALMAARVLTLGWRCATRWC